MISAEKTLFAVVLGLVLVVGMALSSSSHAGPEMDFNVASNVQVAVLRSPDNWEGQANEAHGTKVAVALLSVPSLVDIPEASNGEPAPERQIAIAIILALWMVWMFNVSKDRL